MSNVELFEVKVVYLRSVAEQSSAQISGQQGWQGGCRFATIPELTFPDSSMAEQFAVNEKVLGSSPSRGALTISFRNEMYKRNRTNKQQRYLAKLQKFVETVPSKMDSLVKELRELISTLPPFQVLTTVAIDVLAIDAETYKESEIEKPLLTIEYLTWLFLTNKEQTIEYKMESPDDVYSAFVQGPTYEKIEKLINELFSLSHFQDMKPREKNTSLDKFDELKHRTRTWHLHIRNPSYFQHIKTTLEGLFGNFTNELEDLIGFNLSDVLSTVNFLEIRFFSKLKSRIKKAKTSEKILKIRYEKLIQGKVKPKSKLDEYLKTLSSKQFSEYNSNHAVAWAWLWMEEAFTVSPEELAKGIKIPAERALKILEHFSLPFGQTPIGDSLPSRYEPLELKPLVVKVQSKEYFFHLFYKLMWATKPSFEKALKTNSVYWRRYKSARKNYLEKESLRLLKRKMPGAKVYQNLYYKINGFQERYELDGLIIYDTVAFLVEAKSGIIRDSAKRGADLSMRDDVKTILDEAYEQAIRASRFIDSSPNVSFFLDNGEELKVNSSLLTRKILVTVYLEDLTAFTASLPDLRDSGFIQGEIYPWAVSLDDLRVVTEILKGSEFVHYLQRRLRMNEFKKILIPDEIDKLGFYLKRGLYFEEDEYTDSDHVVFLTFGEVIDDYFLYKQGLRKKLVEKPSQPIPHFLQNLIMELEREKKRGFVEVICSFLDGSDDSRKELELLIENRKMASRKLNPAGMRFELDGKVQAIVCCSGSRKQRLDFLEDYLKASKIKHKVALANGIVYNVDKLNEPPIPAVNASHIEPNVENSKWADRYFAQFPQVKDLLTPNKAKRAKKEIKGKTPLSKIASNVAEGMMENLNKRTRKE